MSDGADALQEWVSALAGEASEAARRALCAAAPASADALLTVVQAKLLELAYSDAQQAERLAQCGEWLALLVGDSQSQGIAARGCGHVVYVMGRYPEAAAQYRRSAQLLESAGASLELGRTLSSAIQTLLYLGCFDEALDWAERARAIFEQAGDHLRMARLSSNCGNIWYRQDRYDKALTCYQDALQGLRQHGQPTDVAAALSNLAVCHISMGEFQQALARYREARAHCEQHGLSRLTAAADYNIAYLHFFRGQYTEALRLYSLTKQHCRDAADPYHAALCDLDESELFLELNLFEEAEQSAMAALQGFDALSMPYEGARASAFAALAAARLGRVKLAHARWKVARRYFQSTGNHHWLATLELFRASLDEQAGRITAALSACRRAEAGYRRAGSSYRALLCHFYRLRLQLKTGAWWEARAGLPAENCELPPPLRYQLALLCGIIAQAGGDLREAEAQYRAARDVLEQLRGQTSTLGQRLAMVEDRCEAYHRLAILALERSDRDENELFHLFEQFRSRTLFESLFAGAGPGMPMHPDIESLESDLNACYRRLETNQAGGGSAQGLSPVRKRIRECEEELTAVLARLRPRLAQDPLDARDAISAKAMRGVLDPHTTLVEWAVLHDRIYACILDHNQIRTVPVATANDVRAALRLLQFQLARQLEGPSPSNKAVIHHLRFLYDKLIAPIRDSINGSRLLFVPHRFLHALPFHALTDGAHYLTDLFQIQYAPSASVFAACSLRQRDSDPALVLSFGDSQTPAIDWEAERLSQLLPRANCLSAQAATREAFRIHAPNCGLLHIAAHSIFRPDNVLFSSLLLSQGAVPLWEVWQTPIRAQLVVLSGCGTGLNCWNGGDELLGFVRAFLGAGANQVVASLWDVQDDSAALFMDSFYRRWVQTNDAPEAVRQAMWTVRDRYPNPAQWAPFAVWGGKNS
ncbi:MAG: CHAT domain-containing protein [Bryobacteraceae bacterium]